MNKATQDVLNYDFPEGFLDTFLDGLAGRASKEVIAGATIGSFIAPVVGTAIGGAIGGWLGGNKQEKEIESIINNYEKAKQNLIQEWEYLWKITYENICKLISELHAIELISYEKFN